MARLSESERLEAMGNVARLRRAERRASSDLQSDLAALRESLEDLVGRTVVPADAARLLAVSQPALKRWLDKGDVPTVLTPEGRREIPLSALIELFDEVEQFRDQGAARPLTAAIRERHRKSDEIDLNVLLPRRRVRTHRIPEIQSLAYHRAVANRLSESVVEEARRRLRTWREDGRIHPQWAEAWERVLEQPLPQIARAISSDSKRARELRQSSPFAGALTEQERKRLNRAVEERLTG